METIQDKNKKYFKYFCDCGVERRTRSDAKITKCLKCRQEERYRSFIGYKTGRLEVLEFLYMDSKNKSVFKCKCICGNIFKARKNNILHSTTSCGCFRAEYNRERLGKNAQKVLARALFNGYKKGATERDLSFEITFEQFENLVKRNCFYCNSPPSRERTRKHHKWKFNGVDRVNNNQGYYIGNIVPCCWNCNRMKLNIPYDEFINHINNIYENMKSKNTINWNDMYED